MHPSGPGSGPASAAVGVAARVAAGVTRRLRRAGRGRRLVRRPAARGLVHRPGRADHRPGRDHRRRHAGRAAAGEGDPAAARAGRIARFREETRQQRMAVADAAQERYGRSVAWGAACGEDPRCSPTCPSPVMTRLRQRERLVLDTLVDAGVARSRSEALAGRCAWSGSTPTTGSRNSATRWRRWRRSAAAGPPSADDWMRGRLSRGGNLGHSSRAPR